MTDLQAIDKRISRRGYTGGVPADAAVKLESWADRFSEEYALHLQLVTDAEALFGGFKKSYGMFTGVKSLFMLAANENDEHGLEKAGHAGERLVLEATKMGLGTCWVGGTFDRKTLAAALPAGQKLLSVITVGTVEENQTGREKFIYRLAHRGTKTLEQLYVAGQGEIPPEWFIQGMKAVQRAPSAVNAQPVFFTFEGGEVTAAVPGNKPFQLIDLGIAKLHFELAAGGRFALGSGGRFSKHL